MPPKISGVHLAFFADNICLYATYGKEGVCPQKTAVRSQQNGDTVWDEMLK